MRLKETEPACYVAPSAEATSRVEGKLFLSQDARDKHEEPAQRESPSPSPTSPEPTR
jgi:hypothetical protein